MASALWHIERRYDPTRLRVPTMPRRIRGGGGAGRGGVGSRMPEVWQQRHYAALEGAGGDLQGERVLRDG